MASRSEGFCRSFELQTKTNVKLLGIVRKAKAVLRKRVTFGLQNKWTENTTVNVPLYEVQLLYRRIICYYIACMAPHLCGNRKIESWKSKTKVTFLSNTMLLINFISLSSKLASIAVDNFNFNKKKYSYYLILLHSERLALCQANICQYNIKFKSKIKTME